LSLIDIIIIASLSLIARGGTRSKKIVIIIIASLSLTEPGTGLKYVIVVVAHARNHLQRFRSVTGWGPEIFFWRRHAKTLHQDVFREKTVWNCWDCLGEVLYELLPFAASAAGG
jgi:hypothetical protein